MKKSQIIAIVVLAILIILGVFYYFFYIYQGQGDSLQALEAETSLENNSEPEEKAAGEEGDREDKEEGEEGDREDKEEGEEDKGAGGNETSDKGNTNKNNTDTSNEKPAESRMSEKTGPEAKKEDSSNVKVLAASHTTPEYRKTFRNPFKEYRIVSNTSGDNLTLEAIKSMLPFKLKGIIGNNYGRLAVIEYDNRTRIIREKTEIEDFWIIDILENELVIVYKGIQFILEMESGILDEL